MPQRHAATSFLDGAAATQSAANRGGKGASLTTMMQLGLPVPPGFTIGTGVCRAFMEHDRLPKRVFGQIEREIRKLEKATGRTFGDPENPLLVSVRSGAAESMPGMMDTLLNIGLDPNNISGLRRIYGKRFACAVREHLVSQWSALLPTTDRPSDSWTQLYSAIVAVLRSWNSARAQAYRTMQGTSDRLGTAVTVQAMVFGNADNDSCSGVVFSSNVVTGEAGLYGEFLPISQGEAIVGGTRTPQPIAEMAQWSPRLYTELSGYVQRLARHYGAPVDVEFTVEKDTLYLLQCREAKLSLPARVTQAVHAVWDGQLSKEEITAGFSKSEVKSLERGVVDPKVSQIASVIGNGLAASPGAAVGVIVQTSEEAVAFARSGRPVILVRPDTSPSDLPGMLVAQAIVTTTGGATSHAAIVARELGLPAIVGANCRLSNLTEGRVVTVDGSKGVVYDAAQPLVPQTANKEVTLFRRWWSALNTYTPRIGFEWCKQRLSANVHLTDFYLTEVMANLCRKSSFAVAGEALRRKQHVVIAESFAAYLLIAIAREIQYYEICARWPIEATAAKQRIDHALEAASATPDAQRQFVRDIWVVFAKAPQDNYGFGGPKWAAIAKALLSFLNGDYSIGVFVDHVFDLEHNGGRLFDKHPMFTALTKEVALRQQLDAKRSISDPRKLYRALTEHAKPSVAVVELWQRITKAGLMP